MPSLYNADLKPLGPGVYTHYYEHATKLFIADTFRLAPKQSFLYYVCINISQDALTSLLSSFGGNSISSQSLIEQYQTGLLAKRVDLPRFNVDTKTFNAYNRKNIVTNKINYEPISITFHDDAADIITNFWNDYYTHYFRDSDYTDTIYTAAHKYQPRQREGWGYTPRMKSLIPFLKSIQIFSLHNKRFTEYRLINPTITSWRHGELDAYNGTGLVENTMTVAYETVKYKTGFINVTELPGFGTINYDNYPSPISNSITNIYTDAGIIGAVAGGSKDLARPDGTGSGKGLTSQALDSFRAFSNLKNVNFKSVASIALGQAGAQILNGVINSGLKNVIVPTLSGIPGYASIFGSSKVLSEAGSAFADEDNQAFGGSQNLSLDAAASAFADEDRQGFFGEFSPYPDPNNGSQVTIEGSAANKQPGLGGSFISRASTAFQRGVAGVTQSVNGAVTGVFQTIRSAPFISVDPESGQPISNQTTTFNLGNTGGLAESVKQVGSQLGSFIPSNPTLNLISSQFGFASPPIIYDTYADGTVVVKNNNNEILQIYPSALSAPLPENEIAYTPTGLPINTNPDSTRNIAATGARLYEDQPQYYTDPVTGSVTRLDVTNARVVVKPGSIDQLYASGLTTKAAGRALTAQVGSAVDSIATKNVQNYTATGGIQPLKNPVTGMILQGVNNVTGSIQNVIGTWVGSGGYNPNYPQQNVVSKQIQTNGDTLYTYKDGTVVTLSSTGETLNIVKGVVNNPLVQWYSTAKPSVVNATPLQPGLVGTDAKNRPYSNIDSTPIKANTEKDN